MCAHYGVVQPLLTDFYQLTMSYGYWKAGKADEPAVFEVFFRKNPFQGEFTIFAGLSDCIEYLESFKFSAEDIAYLKQAMPTCTEEGFFDYLVNLRLSSFSLWSVEEGSAIFPREPIIRVEGPVLVCQLLETTLLNLVNFASLIATNAARFRLAAGPDKKLFEFGLRRAQGPDGGLSASRYAYLGGYDGTSNVLAAKMYGIPVVGTHAHSFISAYQSNEGKKSIVTDSPDDDERRLNQRANPERLPQSELERPYGKKGELSNGLAIASSGGDANDTFLDLHSEPIQLDRFVGRCTHWSERLTRLLNYAADQVHQGELVAFANYAYAFPTHFVGLLDTYDVLRSGLPNFCAVSLALHEYGHQAVGVRIDSGDLAFLSLRIREAFKNISDCYNLPWFKDLRILVSNDLNEETLLSLNHQGHSINAFCVGTNLVTCQKQPALGCVYKLVEISGHPTMKLSAVVDKVTLPGSKQVYRLYSKCGTALLDLLQRVGEPTPKVGERVLCRHPSEASKRAFVVPARVEETLKLFWKDGKLTRSLPTLQQSRERVQQELATLRSDYKRPLNPTPYKVSLSEELYNFTFELWLRMTPIAELT
ncbi:nicotinate phosphoribosyltransferase [Paragonimus westermani]|uniref:Nicotinate phosphoribosyltransferase n=1 Tax=Paragonimus westermani TaxID=34504 RepID=A0A5J4P274_9TREM|nr:nicotinate phosphoribosyltransferase [Paragonimus westermani]